jgi:quercetin dioxygenase-like cupin family protein
VNIKDMVRGWFIGDFEPSVFKTKDFEVGLMHHKKNEEPDLHYHKIITEYNVVISGRMRFEDRILSDGDIFEIAPNQINDLEFLEDTTIVCVKVPSVTNDKYKVKNI